MGPEAGARVVSGDGESDSSMPAAGDPMPQEAATTLSLSPRAANALAAYAAQDENGVTERWSESASKAIAAQIAEVAEAADRTGLRVRTDVHEATGRYIVSVVESETGEILKEFPPADYLDVVAALEEFSGLLLSEEL